MTVATTNTWLARAVDVYFVSDEDSISLLQIRSRHGRNIPRPTVRDHPLRSMDWHEVMGQIERGCPGTTRRARKRGG
jgi:hypothetical protein